VDFFSVQVNKKVDNTLCRAIVLISVVVSAVALPLLDSTEKRHVTNILCYTMVPISIVVSAVSLPLLGSSKRDILMVQCVIR